MDNINQELIETSRKGDLKTVKYEAYVHALDDYALCKDASNG